MGGINEFFFNRKENLNTSNKENKSNLHKTKPRKFEQADRYRTANNHRAVCLCVCRWERREEKWKQGWPLPLSLITCSDELKALIQPPPSHEVVLTISHHLYNHSCKIITLMYSKGWACLEAFKRTLIKYSWPVSSQKPCLSSRTTRN